jgi:hypothetical protein
MSFRIAVISYGGGHINIVLPVVKRCLTAGLDVDLIALTGAKPLAERQGYKTLGYEDFVSGSEKEKIINFGKDLIDQNFNPESGITVEESLCYLGVNWAENLQRYGKKLTETLYDRVGRHSFLPITFFENIIKRNKYDLVVTTNSPKSERAALIAADNLKKPSIRIDDLFFDDNLQQEIIDKLGDIYYVSLGKHYSSPTKICVMSEYTKSLYAEKKEKMLLKTDPDNVVVTGQPILDRLAKSKSDVAPKYFDQLDSEIGIVVWFHQNYTLDEDEVLNLLSNWLNSKSDRHPNLIIKFHPDSSAQQKFKVRESLSHSKHSFLIVPDDENILDLIFFSQVIIAQESTTMLESFFIEKPTICLDPTGIRKNIPYVLNGVSKRVTSADELNTTIHESLTVGSDKMKKVKQKMGFQTNATENIFKIITRFS